MRTQRACYIALSAADLREVRDELGRELRRSGIPEVRVGDAALMVSELVTNSLVHANSPAEVSVERFDGSVRVVVADRSCEPPIVKPVDPARVGGNGMRIVDALSDCWGTENRPEAGKEVWFQIDL